MTAIRRLDAPEARASVGTLAGILVDCVAAGASVGFMAPLAPPRAEAFWTAVADRVAAGTTCLLGAFHDDRLVGTVQLVDAPENQPHRADVAKLLVHPEARRHGVGAALCRAAETEALARGRSLLVLDTVAGEAGARLYRRLGWIEAGTIPGYALFPDGRPCATTIFYRNCEGAAGAGASPPGIDTSR